MAISYTLKTSGAEKVNSAASVTTDSFTPANNCLLLAMLTAVSGGGAGDISGDLTIADTETLSWTPRISNGRAVNYAAQSKTWTAPVTTGASMTITFDCGAKTVYSYQWFIIEITGYKADDPVGGISSSSSATNDGALSTTLSEAPTTSNYVFAMVGLDGSGSGTIGVTQGSGFTEVAEVGAGAAESYAELQVRTGSTSTTVDWQDIRSGSMVTYSHASQGIVIQDAETVIVSLVMPNISSRMKHLFVR